MKKASILTFCVMLAAALGGTQAFGQESGLVLTREAAFITANEIRVELIITGDSGTINTLTALGLEEVFPATWTFNGSYEEYYGETAAKSLGDKAVNIGAHPPGRLELYWIQIPVFPVRIVYELTVSAFEPGQSISGMLYWLTDVAAFEATSPVTVVSPYAGEGEVEGEVAVEGEGEVVTEGETETGSLTGVARNADTELPLSGVLITLMPGNHQDTTGLAGVFSFTDLPVGTYTVTAVRDGFISYSAERTIQTGINALNIQMTPGSTEDEGEPVVEGEEDHGSLSGVVSSSDTALPLYEARVRLVGTGFDQLTDSQGNYQFPVVPVGSYALTVTLSGYVDFSAQIAIAAGANQQNITLTPIPAEGEVEGEAEGEGEGEEPADDCGACCASSKDLKLNWRNYLGDLFLLGLAVLLLSRFNYVK